MSHCHDVSASLTSCAKSCRHQQYHLLFCHCKLSNHNVSTCTDVERFDCLQQCQCALRLVHVRHITCNVSTSCRFNCLCLGIRLLTAITSFLTYALVAVNRTTDCRASTQDCMQLLPVNSKPISWEVRFTCLQVFTRAGLSSPILGSIIVGCVNVAGTVVAAYLMDRTGRRPLLIISHAGMAISLISISLAKFLPCELRQVVAAVVRSARCLSHQAPKPQRTASEILVAQTCSFSIQSMVHPFACPQQL